MKFRLTFLATAYLVCAPPALAQNTRANMRAYNNSTFTPNGFGSITGAMANSWNAAFISATGFLSDTNVWTGANTFTGSVTLPAGTAATNLGLTTGLIAGANVTLTGTWPNQTISSTGGGGGGAFPQTVSGTTVSGGVPYFSSTTALSSSGLLATNALMVGGGAGGTPSTVTTGAGVLTALGLSLNGSGAISATTSPALVTPSWTGAASGGSLTLSSALVTGSGGTGVTANSNTTGGVVLLNGSPTSGDLLQWSASGAQDSGIVTSNVPLLNAQNIFTANQTMTSATQFYGFNVLNGTYSVASIGGTTSGNDGGWIQLYSGGVKKVSINAGGANSWHIPNIGFGANTAPSYTVDVTGTVRATTSYVLNGSSTGVTTLTNNLNGTSSWSLAFPNITANDTLATLGLPQTFSGAISHSGTAAFTGAGLASPAANTTTILGGTTTWTPGSNAGVLGIGGLVAAPTLGANGQGAIYLSSTNGLVMGGQGSNNGLVLTNSTGSPVAFVISSGSSRFVVSGFQLAGFMYASGTVPTVNTGGCTTLNAATGGSMAGKFTVNGTACTVGQTIILAGFTAVPNGYNCDLKDITTPTAVFNQTALATTSATFTLAGVNTGTTDTLTYKCMGF